MDDFLEAQNSLPHGDNMPEMSVFELANALKKTVEEICSFVRLRGELGAWRPRNRTPPFRHAARRRPK